MTVTDEIIASHYERYRKAKQGSASPNWSRSEWLDSHLDEMTAEVQDRAAQHAGVLRGLVQQAAVRYDERRLRTDRAADPNQETLGFLDRVVALGNGERVSMSDLGAREYQRAFGLRTKNLTDAAAALDEWEQELAPFVPHLFDSGLTVGECVDRGLVAPPGEVTA